MKYVYLLITHTEQGSDKVEVYSTRRAAEGNSPLWPIRSSVLKRKVKS